MSISPGVLVVSLAIGIPLLLLALGVLYHAYVLGRQAQPPAAAPDVLEAHVEALATESAEQLLASMQTMMRQMQGQLASQRASLERLLSDPQQTRLPATATAAPRMNDYHSVPGQSAPAQPMAAGEFISQHATAPTDLRMQVRQLATEGLSDRAIARQLGIGLEEVRIARMRGMRS